MNGQNNPPTDIAPSDLLLKLMDRPQPSELVDYPARSTNGTPLARIRIMVIRMEQHDEARFRAKEYLKGKRRLTDEDLRTPFGVSMLGDATARELIAMACHMVEPIHGTEDSPKYPLIFRTSADVNKLPADEVTALFGAYLMVQKRYGPYERELDDQEVNAWIERLEVGASELPLSLLESHQRDELVMCLAARASTFSKLLVSQRQNSPINWESIPESWGFTTGSLSAPAADSSSSDEERVITAEEAMAAAKKIIGR